MKNKEKLIYTYKHRQIVIKLAKKYKCLTDKIKYHDLDKMFMLLFYDKDISKKIHNTYNNHHDNEISKTKEDYIEMVIDWESARYTKLDKPLNAYDTLVNYYPHLKEQILPILKEFKIDKPNLPMDKKILEYSKSLDNITEEDIKKELIKYIKQVDTL